MMGDWSTRKYAVMAAPLLPFTSLWLPTLPAILLIYPGIETAFRIEEKLRERQKSE